MNDELLAMLLDILIAQQTAGQQGMGGDLPYDDYGLQGTIGGLGAIDPSRPTDMSGDLSIGAMTGAPAQYDTSPSTVGFYGPQARLEHQRVLNNVLAAMQQGVGAGTAPMYGLFGSPGLSISRSSVAGPPQVTPAANPVAGSVSRTSPQATPDPSRDISTLPERDKPKGTPTPKGKAAPISRAPQAAQAIATAGRQMSAPAQRSATPASAPASRRVTTPGPAPTRSTSTFSGNVARNVARSRNR